jgi:hypothetical protein
VECLLSNVPSPNGLVMNLDWTFEFGWAWFAGGHRLIEPFAASEGRWR